MSFEGRHKPVGFTTDSEAWSGPTGPSAAPWFAQSKTRPTLKTVPAKPKPAGPSKAEQKRRGAQRDDLLAWWIAEQEFNLARDLTDDELCALQGEVFDVDPVALVEQLTYFNTQSKKIAEKRAAALQSDRGNPLTDKEKKQLVSDVLEMDRREWMAVSKLHGLSVPKHIKTPSWRGKVMVGLDDASASLAQLQKKTDALVQWQKARKAKELAELRARNQHNEKMLASMNDMTPQQIADSIRDFSLEVQLANGGELISQEVNGTKHTASVPDKSSVTLELDHDGARIKFSNALKLYSSDWLTPTTAPNEIGYSFATGKIYALGSWFNDSIADALNKIVKENFIPTAMQQPGYSFEKDPNLLVTLQQLQQKMNVTRQESENAPGGKKPQPSVTQVPNPSGSPGDVMTIANVEEGRARLKLRAPMKFVYKAEQHRDFTIEKGTNIVITSSVAREVDGKKPTNTLDSLLVRLTLNFDPEVAIPDHTDSPAVQALTNMYLRAILIDSKLDFRSDRLEILDLDTMFEVGFFDRVYPSILGKVGQTSAELGILPLPAIRGFAKGGWRVAQPDAKVEPCPHIISPCPRTEAEREKAKRDNGGVIPMCQDQKPDPCSTKPMRPFQGMLEKGLRKPLEEYLNQLKKLGYLDVLFTTVKQQIGFVAKPSSQQ